MGETTGISWCDMTFNPWIGCTKVSEACTFCYAERDWDHRRHRVTWGPHGDRSRTSESYWNQPHKWNREAKSAGIRPRVFCASLADVFDNHKSILPEWRADLWTIIEETPWLDWLLLTKRPQNIERYILPAWHETGCANLWLGTTVENQEEADRRIPLLAHAGWQVGAERCFLSMEPLLGPVDLGQYLHSLDWVITGGESGPGFRTADPDWFRQIRDDCQDYGVPFFFKQWSGPSQPKIKALGRELDGRVWNDVPSGGQLTVRRQRRVGGQ